MRATGRNRRTGWLQRGRSRAPRHDTKVAMILSYSGKSLKRGGKQKRVDVFHNAKQPERGAGGDVAAVVGAPLRLWNSILQGFLLLISCRMQLMQPGL